MYDDRTSSRVGAYWRFDTLRFVSFLVPLSPPFLHSRERVTTAESHHSAVLTTVPIGHFFPGSILRSRRTERCSTLSAESVSRSLYDDARSGRRRNKQKKIRQTKIVRRKETVGRERSLAAVAPPVTGWQTATRSKAGPPRRC
ncbi:hypothetical protein MRX96_054528 [Rhipicephalus microplus]